MISVLTIPHRAFEQLSETHELTRLKGGFALYRGALLPKELRPFRSRDLSLARWIEDERNATVLPVIEHGDRVFGDERTVDLATVLKSQVVIDPDFERFDIVPTMLDRMFRDAPGRNKVLVVTSRTLKEEWRRSLTSHRELCSSTRMLVVDHDEASRLLKPPPQARLVQSKTVKKTQTVLNGKVSLQWDCIVIDSPEQVATSNRDVLLLKGLRRSSTASLTVYGKSERSPYDYRVCCENLALDAETTEDFVRLLKTRLGLSVGIVRGVPVWPSIPASGRGAAYDRGYARAIREREQSIVSEWVERHAVRWKASTGGRELRLPLDLDRKDRVVSSWKDFVTDIHSNRDVQQVFDSWRTTVLRESMPAIGDFANSLDTWSERCVFVMENWNEVDYLLSTVNLKKRRKTVFRKLETVEDYTKLHEGDVGVTTRATDTLFAHTDDVHRFSLLLPLTKDRTRDWLLTADPNTSRLGRLIREKTGSGLTFEQIVKLGTAVSLQF